MASPDNILKNSDHISVIDSLEDLIAQAEQMGDASQLDRLDALLAKVVERTYWPMDST